tara:strand:- start:1635 stop:1799 length:165 start_codon:yes stop_codon:yes gene_type:complete
LIIRVGSIIAPSARALQAVRQAAPSTASPEVSNARHRHTPAARQSRAGMGEEDR